MNAFIESLRRLFLLGEITPDKLQEMQADNKITSEELAFIAKGLG